MVDFLFGFAVVDSRDRLLNEWSVETKITHVSVMENLQKFSNPPPSSLSISQGTEDGSSSSASTPSEDYKTPPLEHVAIPGFDFGIKGSEPEAPSKLLQDAGMPQCLVSETEMVICTQECTGVSASVLLKSLNFSQVSLPSVTICGTKSPTRHFGAGHDLIKNGTNVKMSTSKHCDESCVIPLMRSPPSTSHQVKETSFAASPNQTTWLEETVQRGSSLECDQSKVTCDVLRSQSTELSGIRHKLEERRKQIENEKKKMEIQWSKQRQQVGKEAFIQVMTKQNFESGFQNDLKIRMQKESPAHYHEVSDGKPMLIREQERQFPKPLLCDSETALHLVPSSLSRTETVKEFGTGNLLTENSSDSSGSNKKAKVSLKESAHVKTDKVSDRKVSSAVNASAGYHSDVSEYGTSLDRLNSSLTELQGEIMRLSLQQDQIKSLVGSDMEPALESTRSFYTPVSSQKAKDQFYLFPRNTSGTICGTRDSTVPSFDNSMVSGVNGSSVYCVSGQNSTSLFGSSKATHFSGTKTFENPLGFVNPGHGTPLSGELLPSAAIPTNAQYANQRSAFPYYYPMPRLPYLDGIGYSMPMTNLVHPSVSQIPVSQQGSVNHPVQNFNPHAGLWHAVGPAHRSGDGYSVTGDATMTELIKPQQIFSSSSLSDHDFAINDKTSEVAVPLKSFRMQSPLLLKSDLHCSDSKNYDHQNIPTSSASLSSPVNCIGSTPSSLQAESKPLNIPLIENETVPSSAPSETFFTVLESDLSRQPKPVLSTNHRKNETLSTAMPGSHSIPAANNVGIMAEGKTAPGSVLCAAPSVGFVIGGEESSTNQELQQEVEKRRQQMAEMHQRRQREMELKKQKIEIEQQTKREVLRLKQEKDYEKRAKEKMRREEIFQSYLQKKAEEDGSEEDSKISSRGTGKRLVKSRAKLHLPKSQPPPSSDIHLYERGFSTPSSIGGLLTDPRTGSPSSDLSRSSEHLNILTTNFEDLEARLALGNLGQKTPSVTDRVSRFLSSSSDGGSDVGIGGAQVPDNYAGPKLFVKPSQKSNRHIIVNAIKDCCLAGLVNQDMKNKVVEEINKSDSKHFVILFRDASMQYRGLYTYNPEREDVFKIHGVGPNRLLDKTMEKFYKYNSGAKSFTEVTSTKHLSATIDAITILGVLWQKKPPTGQSKWPI